MAEDHGEAVPLRESGQPAVHQLKPSVLAHARVLGEGNIASASDANRATMVTPGPLVYLSERHQRVAGEGCEPDETATAQPSKAPPVGISAAFHFDALATARAEKGQTAALLPPGSRFMSLL